MEQQELEQSETKICQFMVNLKKDWFWGHNIPTFHNSYDNLMRVVEVITGLDYRADLISYHDSRYNGALTFGFRFDKYATIISFSESREMRMAIYKSVIKFINWYNLNNNKN